jgi:hypothetical protein
MPHCNKLQPRRRRIIRLQHKNLTALWPNIFANHLVFNATIAKPIRDAHVARRFSLFPKLFLCKLLGKLIMRPKVN